MDGIEEFVPVELEEIISTPRKVELLMELKARGFRRSEEKKVQAKVTWVAEQNFLEHQINMQVRKLGYLYTIFYLFIYLSIYLFIYFYSVLSCFGIVGWHQEEHPVCKN